MALTLKTSGIATNCIGALVNDAGTIKLYQYGGSTLTVGGGLTASGTITAESTPTTWNTTHSVYEITVAADSMLEVDGTITWDWAAANGTSVFAAFTALTADATDGGAIVHNAGANYNAFFITTSGDLKPIVYCYGGGTGTFKAATAAPTDGTDFSTGFRFQNSDTGEVWYGVAGSAGAFNTPTSTGGWTDSTGSLKRFFRDSSAGAQDLPCKCILIAVFNTSLLSDDDFASLHSDPIGTLFDGTGSTSVAPLAMVNSASIATPSIWLPSNRKFTY